jgi:hypothetical protein
MRASIKPKKLKPIISGLSSQNSLIFRANKSTLALGVDKKTLTSLTSIKKVSGD